MKLHVYSYHYPLVRQQVFHAESSSPPPPKSQNTNIFLPQS